MKITTVINAQGLNPASGIGRKASPGSSRSAPNTAAADQSRRFDTFTMIGTEKSEKSEKPAENLSAAKEKLIRDLSTVSDEDKADIALGSYLDMIISLDSSKAYAQKHVNMYNRFKDQLAYYTELEQKGGVIEGKGRYAFEEMKEGDIVSLDRISAGLAKAQDGLDRLCGGVYDSSPNVQHAYEDEVLSYKFHQLNEKIFASSAAVFSAVTGQSGSVLEVEKGDLIFDKSGINEENLFEKANAYIEDIENRKKAVTDMWTKYTFDNIFAKNINPTEATDRLNNMEEPLRKMLAEFCEAFMSEF
ncbi:MAG: hypothetical protein NC203_06270 [Firmicutes bacterium]|nr:hypothetical protein [Bacillota bacterium]